MQALLNRLKVLEDWSKPSVESLKRNITQYAFGQTYTALNMVEILKNVANQTKHKRADYFASVHATLQERISKPAEQFKSYLLSLIGDRHYDKIMEAVGKVDKNFSEELSTPSMGQYLGPMLLLSFLAMTILPT